MGTTVSRWTLRGVAQHGRTRERSRFRRRFAVPARIAALSAAGFDLGDTLETLPEGNKKSDDNALYEWTVDDSFPEILGHLLVPGSWSITGSGIFKFSEQIMVLEARALLRCFSSLMHDHCNHNRRHPFSQTSWHWHYLSIVVVVATSKLSRCYGG